jgi:hypothetical protein
VTGRVCHAIELLENYVDVAVQRSQAFTGEVATLDGSSGSQSICQRVDIQLDINLRPVPTLVLRPSCRSPLLSFAVNGVYESVAMTDEPESALIYNCPSSGRAVRTSIVTSRLELTRLARVTLSLWCPHCDAPHKIAGRGAFLASALQTAS